MSVKAVTLFKILSIFVIYCHYAKADCNVCLAANQMACVSSTEFQFCVNNIPSGPVNTCPTGYLCSTATTTICLPNNGAAVATCRDGCNTCNANLVFACTGINTYALCLGQATPSSVVYTCPTGQVCNINNPYICGSPSTVFPASCLSDTTTTTSTTTAATTTTLWTTIPTPSVPTYAQYFCEAMQINTRFRVPREYDNTCKKYIYCARTRNGTWTGQMYTCAGSTYFDSASLYCVASRPSNC